LILLLVLVAGAIPGGVAPPPPGRVYVVDRPPRAPVEVAGAIPGAGWVWIPGRYQWQQNGFLWQGGHWDRVPRGKQRWERGHWDHSRRGWYWVEGRWR
jgi:hypothetical protein